MYDSPLTTSSEARMVQWCNARVAMLEKTARKKTKHVGCASLLASTYSSRLLKHDKCPRKCPLIICQSVVET
jgi:hypothetical protein